MLAIKRRRHNNYSNKYKRHGTTFGFLDKNRHSMGDWEVFIGDFGGK